MIAETSVPRPIVQRWRWLAVFLSGLVLWILSVVVTGLTQNPNLIPTVVLLGSFLVPATAVIYYLDHSPSTTVSTQRVFFAFLYGGVLGVLAASVLEAWLLQNGPLVYVGVGLIEEFVKVLALLLVALGIRHFTTRDGIVLGASVGFGFAAFESSGYALSALFTPNGLSLTSLVFAEVLRGVLAPLGHGLWTGILGGALFAAASKRGRLAIFSLRFIGLFLLVSLLHALWDSMRGLAIVMTLLVTSSPALNVLMQGGLLPQTTDVVTWIFLAFEFGGMAVVSAIGLLMLRRAWRRARPPIASLT
ncbi:MAG: PrsW family intramembrane metalloprotease, partial [Isosphaeraceae bacterium]